jgi:hypothetical protein
MHTGHCVVFIVEKGKRFAYLVDSVADPVKTVRHLKDLDLSQRLHQLN